MADSVTVSGGVRNNVQALVSADQETITGDGTTENPLRAISGTISVDDVSILGNGTAGNPLRAAIPVIAAANVNSNGVYLEQKGFTGDVENPNTGEYLLTLSTPLPPGAVNSLVPMISIAGFIGGQSSYLFDANNNIIHVYTFDSSGAAASRIFSICVLSLAQT